MNKIKMITFISVCLLYPFVAVSNDVGINDYNSGNTNIDAIDDSFFNTSEGGYLTAKSGGVFFSENCATNNKCDAFSPYYNAIFGYNFNKWGGVELGLGTIIPAQNNSKTAESDISFYHLNYIKGFGSQNHQLLLKFGAISWVNHSSGNDMTLSSNGISPTLGITYQYRFRELPLGLQLGYDYSNQLGGENTTGHLFSIGLTYFFSQPSATKVTLTPLVLPRAKQPTVIYEPVELKQPQNATIVASPVINVCFETDSNKLDELNKRKLTILYDNILKYSRLQIIGFADDTGTIEYNKKLVQRRVDSIKKYLETLTMGKDGKLLNIETINSSNVAPRFSERSLNRCAEVIIIH